MCIRDRTTASDKLFHKLSGLLKPDVTEKITGNVEIREVFNISKIGNIAGCMVKDGFVSRNSKIRLFKTQKFYTESY